MTIRKLARGLARLGLLASILGAAAALPQTPSTATAA